MKTLVLTACLAVTAATAAELKDPADVAQDWARAVTQARESSLSTSLLAQSTLPASQYVTPGFTFEPPAPPAMRESPPRGPGRLYDAPSRPRLRRVPPEIPDHAIPWLYRDQTYWLVPLGGPAD